MTMKRQKILLILNLQKYLLQPQIFQMKDEPHFFENPLFNNNGDSDPQSPQHKKPKWTEQLLIDVHSDEMNKT
jgi:hypothetical protein